MEFPMLNKPATWKCQWEEQEKKLFFMSTLSSQRARKEAVRQDRKLLDNDCSIPVKYTENLWPPSTFTPEKALWGT